MVYIDYMLKIYLMYWDKWNILLKTTFSFFFTILNVATSKFEFTHDLHYISFWQYWFIQWIIYIYMNDLYAIIIWFSLFLLYSSFKMILLYSRVISFISTYTCIFSHFFDYGLSQDIEYSSLYYTVGPCLLIPYTLVCIC